MFSETKIIFMSSNTICLRHQTGLYNMFIFVVWIKVFMLENKVFFLLGFSMLLFCEIGSSLPLSNCYFYSKLEGGALYTLHRNRLLVSH